jgi:hypothetical protein
VYNKVVEAECVFLSKRNIGQNLEGIISSNKIKSISAKLFASRYQISAFRRIYISNKEEKYNVKLEKRSLIVMSTWDKIIAQSINICLLQIFEGTLISS